jgi:hypothetical protein
VQVITNQKLISRRKLFGRLATFGGFACLVGGLAISWLNTELILVAYATLLPGFFLITYGKANTIRFGVKPRVDEVLSTALKAHDSKYQLFNYVDGLPADNLLLTPQGLVVFELKPLFGEFINTGAKWRRNRSFSGLLLAMGEGGLGNPTQDALRSRANVQQYLVERLGQEQADQVPVEPMVVFTHPRANVTLESPEVPVVLARDLKQAVRKEQGRARLSVSVYRKLAQEMRSGAPQGSK